MHDILTEGTEVEVWLEHAAFSIYISAIIEIFVSLP